MSSLTTTAPGQQREVIVAIDFGSAYVLLINHDGVAALELLRIYSPQNLS